MPQATEDRQADGRPGSRWSRILRALRRVVGAPDYGAYLDHCRRAGHPPEVTEREYVRAFFETKGKGIRCC